MVRPLFERKTNDDISWESVSDLMAGLMMVFLFILIIYARNADERLESAKDIVIEWRNSETLIYEALVEEFEDDLEKWDAEINKETLTVRFRSPDILFETGESTLRPRFELILDDFMPRYLDLIVSKFIDKVEEVRIEGHTSSE